MHGTNVKIILKQVFLLLLSPSCNCWIIPQSRHQPLSPHPFQHVVKESSRHPLLNCLRYWQSDYTEQIFVFSLSTPADTRTLPHMKSASAKNLRLCFSPPIHPFILSCIFWSYFLAHNKALTYKWGTKGRSCLRNCATSQKVTGSIPDGVTGIFHWHNPSGRTLALGVDSVSTRNEYKEYFLGG